MSAERKARRGAKELGLCLIVGIIAFSLGCSADDIMGPGSTGMPGDVPEDGPDRSQDINILADPDGMAVLSDEGDDEGRGTAVLVSADEGGIVSWGRFSLEFPPGALSEDTVISVDQPNPHLIMCELQPHGLQFNVPVTLRIDYGGSVAEDEEASMPALGVYWYNQGTGCWEGVGDNLDAEGDKMEAQLEHFSKYTAGWGG